MTATMPTSTAISAAIFRGALKKLLLSFRGTPNGSARKRGPMAGSGVNPESRTIDCLRVSGFRIATPISGLPEIGIQ
jgi:hypothetical protein